MWGTNYIEEIQMQFVEVYGFKANPDQPQFVRPAENPPDGEYPMTIEGKVDFVRIIDERISCCNFEKEGTSRVDE